MIFSWLFSFFLRLLLPVVLNFYRKVFTKSYKNIKEQKKEKNFLTKAVNPLKLDFKFVISIPFLQKKDTRRDNKT